MMDESICDFRGAGSISSLFSNLGWKNMLANTVNPDQAPHDVASNLGLHCLLTTLFRVSR